MKFINFETLDRIVGIVKNLENIDGNVIFIFHCNARFQGYRFILKKKNGTKLKLEIKVEFKV